MANSTGGQKADSLQSGVLLNRFSYGKYAGFIAGAFIIFCLLAWFFTRDTLPREIRIATGETNGQYYNYGRVIGNHLVARTGKSVAVLPTRGSVENRELLLAGEAELALLQCGAVSVRELAVITPLYDDVMHVVARKGRGIAGIRELAGRNVSIGPAGSGMRQSALAVLKHHEIDADRLKHGERYFMSLLTDEEMDAAIVTTGYLNSDLALLLQTGKFELLPILDAEAIAIRSPFFHAVEIPRGLYSGGGDIPPEKILTLSTTTFLAGPKNISPLLISTALKILYEDYLKDELPVLHDASSAQQWIDLPLHPVTRQYFQPYAGIDVLANLMDSLNNTKELLFALGAGIYLLWARRRKRLEEEENAELQRLKERLDNFLDQTVAIERAQIGVEDPARLKEYLTQVTLIKLQALEELTHEGLRGDRLFSIFLMQCANLIRKLQTKILIARENNR